MADTPSRTLEPGVDPVTDILQRVGDPVGERLLNPNADHFQSGERLYLTADARVVSEGDPDAARLLVAKGGYISRGLAQELGLTNEMTDAPADASTDGDQPADENADGQIDDLEKTKVADLREMAAGMGIDGTEDMKKADVIAAIRATQNGPATVPATTPPQGPQEAAQAGDNAGQVIEAGNTVDGVQPDARPQG